MKSELAPPQKCCWCSGDIYLAYISGPGPYRESWYHFRQGYYMRSLICPVSQLPTQRNVLIQEDPF